MNAKPYRAMDIHERIEMEMEMELLCTERQREGDKTSNRERKEGLGFQFFVFNSFNSEGQYCPLSTPFNTGPKMDHKNFKVPQI